jgi:NHL repeat
MTACRTACVFVFSCVLLLTQVAATTAAAAAPASEAAAAAPGSIFTLAGDPLIEGRATAFGQSVEAMAVSGQTLYIADGEADVIRALDTSTDEERVIAGTSAKGFGGDGGPAVAAEFDDLNGVVVDQQGDLLVTDSGNGRVRLIAATDCNSDCPYGLASTIKGDIYTIAGSGRQLAFSEGPAVDSGVGEPRALAIDAHGDLTVSDGNMVLMIADYNCDENCPYGLPAMVKGDIYHIAGREYYNEYSGDGEPATSTGMDPEGLAIDGEGDLLITDSYYTTDRVLLVAAANCAADCAYGLPSTTAGYVYTIAGGGIEALESNGLATSARISPSRVQVDTAGDVLFTEGFEEGRVLMVAAETCTSDCAYGLAATIKDHIYTIAGGGSGLGNGMPGTQAMLVNPRAMAIVANGGLLLVSDQSVWLLASVTCTRECAFGLPATSANDVYTVAGNGTASFSGESGPPTGLEVGWPSAVTSDAAGDVLVLDARNGRMRMIAATKCDSGCAYGLPSTVRGEMYTIAGGGSRVEDAVPARSATLFGVREDGQLELGETPTSVTVDASGDVIVSDGRRLVRLVAAFDCTTSCPYGLHAMVEGDIYTIAGEGGHGDDGDGGPAIDAELGGGAMGMAVDHQGDLLIADTGNNRVRLVAGSSCTTECPYGLPAIAKGDIYTVAGTGEDGDKGDGKPATDAQLSKPDDVTVDGEGNLLIADTYNLRVRFVAAHSCASDCAYGQKSTTAGDIYPLAGDGSLFYPEGTGTDGDGGRALAAPMQPPQAIAVDSADNVLIGEGYGSGSRSVVRMVAAASCSSGCAYGLPATVEDDIYTVAGVNSTVSGFSGDGGPATEAYLDGVTGLGFDSVGDLLIADTYNNRVRLVTPAASSANKESEGPSETPTEHGHEPESPAGGHLTEVNVRIVGRTETLFEAPIWTEGHDVHSTEPDGNAAEDTEEHPCDGINQLDPQNLEPGPTPTAASVDAMELIGETEAMDGQWYAGFNDYFIKRWGSEEENAEHEGKSWGILVNNVYTDVGGCQYELQHGDEVLWIYNAFQSRPILGLFAANEHYSSGARPLTATAELDRPFEVEVDAFDDHGEGRPPATPERTPADTQPYEGAEVAPVQTAAKGFETVQRESAETVLTNSEGKARITFTTPGWHRIMAGTPLRALTKEEEQQGVIPEEEEEEEAIRSNRLDVCVPAAGQMGCGEPPAEDQTRTPPRYLHKHEEQPKDKEQSQEPPTGPATNTSGPPTPTVSATSAGGPPAPTVSGAPTPQPSPGTSTVRSTTHARVSIINDKQLKLDFTGAGQATVEIAHESGQRRHRRWLLAKRVTVRATKAGAVLIKLPRLAPGVYRVTVELPGSANIVTTLTVPHAQR